MTLLAWVLGGILSLDPDAPDAGRLALAIATAAEERSIFPRDADGRKTAGLLIAVAWWETGRSFDCSRVGDNGHSVSCFQIWAKGPEQRELLRVNVFEAARVARDLLAQSMRECRGLAIGERLSKYCTGKCQTNKESRIRWATGERLYRRGEGSR